MVSSALIHTFFYCFAVTTTVALKWWVPTTNLNDKRNWNILDIPKNCDDISFAVTTGLSLLWSFRGLILTGLKLPSTGILTFEKDMTIYFKDKGKCAGVRDVVYKRNEWKGWLDPDNWKSDSQEMWKPHAQRIPCSGENIKFPLGNHFAIQLPTIMVPVGKVYLEDEEYDGDDWGDFLNTEVGKNQFTSEKVAQAAWLHDVDCGKRNCTCEKSAYVFKEREYHTVPSALLHQAVCLYAKKTCGRIQCYSPVVPEGHCCGVCGAVIKIRDNSEDDSFLVRIREIVKKKVENAGGVQYYVGRTLDDNIQVAVVSETGEHADDALTLAASLNDDLDGEHLGSLVSAKFSGSSYSGSFFNNTTGIVFGTLFAVLLFFASIYFVYIVLPEKKKCDTSCDTSCEVKRVFVFDRTDDKDRNAYGEWKFACINPICIITGEHPFQFARFKNALHEAGSEERLQIGTEEALPCDNSEGFQNPTFETHDGPSTSEQEPEEKSSNETDMRTETARQEYDNPTYHEMEKTKDFNFFEVKNEEKEFGEDKKFSEIEL